MAIRQGVNAGITLSPVANYVIANEPTAAEASDTILYYGFVAWDGGWYLQKRDTILGVNYFCFGEKNYDYSTKLSQAYSRFDLAARV